MKRYSLYVALHIIAIAGLSVLAYKLFEAQLWFSLLLVCLLLTATGTHLYTMQMKYLRMVYRLTDSIRFDDTSQSFPVQVKNKVIQEVSEEFSSVLKIFRNRMLDEEVKQQYYENLLGKVDTALLVIDKEGSIEWMNQTAISLLSATKQIPQDILDAIKNNSQIITHTKNGTIQEITISSTSFIAQGVEKLLISLKDIQSVLERNEMEAWQKLIRVLTHEIMNSITPIISLSETLSERELSGSVVEKDYAVMLQAMQTIHRRSKGLLSFVENYRRLTRIPQPKLTTVSVNGLLADIKKLYSDSAIEVIPLAIDKNLEIDRTQIEQVLINLIRNAKEACATNTEPQIVIKAVYLQDKKQVELSVKDNGEGILPEVLDKIFIPFYTTKASGSGIGLSLCKQILALHNSRIRAQSEVNKGSVFTISFR